MTEISVPTIQDIKAAHQQLYDQIRLTPVWQWKGDVSEEAVGRDTQVYLKMELFQYAGSFKPRGALMNMHNLTSTQLEKGVTAVSAGNHAIAVAYAAKSMNTTAKVVMPKSANKYRVEKCRSLGAEVELVDDVHLAFDRVEEIKEQEGRAFIHPFEGRLAALGTATVGLELHQEVPDLDAVIVPIGGGGLCAGISSAIKQLNPQCKVFGVEPEGADSMSKSLKSGKPESIEKVATIADSLGAPHAAPYSFALCQKFVNDVVLVTDQELASAMKLTFEELKLAVEPAGASALAALVGPLKYRLEGKKVGLILCGTNINTEAFNQILEQYL
ncbi:threonine/serine dehydratase [Aliifodinibius sp. S!AR15-10]|uniref:threonine ammonia-lyase n=1 Tax=Aliifodinibius sp. S!AR15-10 TaxID=2950437 RepID=UPI0028575209|nr:threonine/serine dehydratase [Aliifodinibius sp. S!AR15-10]MDR8390425.1 threonine/serine dehydratase [Aliifodinibius sp. S!AR15-10]